MELENTLKLAKKYLGTAILAGLFLGAISFLILIVTQKSFRSNTDILIVQNQEGVVDYYAMSRSADYLSNILSQTIHSEKFLDETIATGKISAGLFSNDQAQKLNAWQKTISIKKNPTVGILTLEVFGDTERQANDISSGVLDVLINKNSTFLGANQNLKIQVLSGPITEKNPSVSKIILASFGGFLIGIILIFMWVIYRIPEIEAKRNKGTIEFHPLETLDANSDYWKEKLNNK
ncbi:MAG: hypothetical protein Q7U36_04890 [bacterium]|nr:hypothetical protein [bacterium]